MLYDDEGIVGGVAGDARNGGLGQYQEDDQGQYEYATDSVTCENYGSDGGQQVLPNNGGVEGEIQIQDQDPASGSSDYVSSFCDIGSIAATAIVEMQSLWQQTGKTAWACAEVVRALHSEVARIFTSAVDAERAAVIALDARWVSAVRDFSLLHASLGSDAGGKLADIQDLPLYQRVEISESRNAVLLAEYEKRKAQRDEAKQSLLALWAEMSISAGDSLPDESDLSPEALDWFLDALKQAQTEKEDRELNCRTLLSEAISLSEELGIPTDLSDSTDSCQGGPHQKPMRLSMSDMKLTPEYGDTLQEVVMSLNTLKKEREGMVNKCQAAIINLNTFLGEDPSVSKNLFSSIKGLGADSISLYEAEVTRLEEAKRCYVDNQLTLIVEQIVSVWQNIGLEPPCIFAEHRDDPVDRLAALRAELTWLKKIETEKQKILSLIHKYEEVTREKVAFDKETSDSSRLNGRAAGKGLRLLAEEKERKRLSRLLVQIAQDLYGALREWSSFTPSVSTTTTSTSSAALPAYMQINLPKFETQDRQDYLALLQSQLRRVLPSTPGLRAQATMTTLTTLGATSIKRQGGPNNPGTPSKRSRTEQKH
ncbi:protein regulator of cytokinesis 1 [Pelomyxa schiedti]|nr:protein regulator of cytokinesis 1 [Pelomyxa schiedti]